MTPKFIFVGPTKSGTTWIDNYLRTRREILLPQLTKETFFFDKRYDMGLKWYAAQFGNPKTDTLCVEVAPSLFGKPEAAARVARDLPGVTVVGTIRHPLDRAVSHYYHYLKTGASDDGFQAMHARHPDLIEAGFYHKHLRMWVDLLGRDRVKTLSYDQLRTAPEAFCAELCDILGIPYVTPSAELARSSVNEATVPRHPLLAGLARNGADNLRKLGAHRIVNYMRGKVLRRIAYGPPPDREHRERIRAEAAEYAMPIYARDLQQLRIAFGIDLRHRGERKVAS